jgi:LPXTG-motif cell wall-anchored protein
VSSAAVSFTVAAAPPTGNNTDGDNTDGNLATTGSDFDAAPFVGGAALLLLIGAGVLVYARRRSSSVDA